MNQQLQTKAMALLTALLQGASSAERQVSVLSRVRNSSWWLLYSS